LKPSKIGYKIYRRAVVGISVLVLARIWSLLKKARSNMKKNFHSRRNFLKTSAIAVTGASTFLSSVHLLASSPGQAKGAAKPLKMTGYEYPRVGALATGKVKIGGSEVQFTPGKIGGMNTQVFNGPQTYDISEIGLHPFILAYANDDFRDYTLLPIFPLRVFRHKSIFIRTDRGIKKPEDLRGKSIAMPGYSSTSLTWIRGILQDEYGVSPNDVEWVLSGKDSGKNLSGTVSKYENLIPDGLTIRTGSPDKDESDLLESGEVDALFHALQPRAFIEGNPIVGRLFPDSRAAEQAYFKKTGIFPIMHAVAIRKSLLKENPWLAQATFDAYSEAKKLNYRQMTEMGWAFDALPWYGQELEATREVMGDNFYSYGLSKPNRKTVETLCRYSFEQGMSRRQLTVEELFAPEGLDMVEAG
jgi:4,5-dihydroxyphthalate decarboxylase